MYVLHIGNKNYSSWSLRPWVLMRELGIPFEERLHIFEPGSSWDEFRVFSPSGQVPCLYDGDTPVWDSLAIAEHLAQRHEGVWPTAPAARTWARCASAEMHAGFSTLRSECPMNVGVRIRPNAASPKLARDVERIDELWREGLARFGGPFLAGERFGAADAFFAPVAYRMRTYDLPVSAEARAYADRLIDLPSMRAWEADALKEPWREEHHEDEGRAAGEWLEDFRQR